jgi:ferredoxin-NADP reductase
MNALPATTSATTRSPDPQYNDEVDSLELRVRSVRRATPSTRIIQLDLDGTPFPYRPGQLAFLGFKDDRLRLPYSIASAPAESERRGHLEFLTRLDPSGPLRNLRRGVRVVVEGPAGTFTFPPHPTEENVLFVAGGTGIAPLRSMIEQAVSTGLRGRLRLLYSARTPVDFAYLTELRRHARRGDLELALTATREVPPRWRGDRGRITLERLAALVDTPDTLCFVCGPMAMVDDVPRMLRELGIPNERIRIEEW